MNLYHGSNIVIEIPNLKFSRKELDFGVGFYTTTNYEQAVLFSEKVVERKKGNKIVNIYDFDSENLHKFKVLEFKETDKKWLEKELDVNETLNRLKIKKLFNRYARARGCRIV
jgi:hypothetical protein